MHLNMEIDSELLSTPLPNFFIDNFMAATNPIFSLIYIYLVDYGVIHGIVSVTSLLGLTV